MRKPRIQGKIANLAPNDREQVHDWFRQNLTYEQVAERIQKEFGMHIATSSLSLYYSSHWQEIFSQILNDGQAVPVPIVQIEIGPQIEMGAVLLKTTGKQIVQIFGREKPPEPT